MQFTLLLHESPEALARRDDPENGPGYWGAYAAYGQALAEAGVLVGGAALHGGDAATTVRYADGSRLVQDGPFADSKEQLGGYFVIEVPDLDAALDWAARSPAAEDGVVEVRPVVPLMASEQTSAQTAETA